MSYKTKHKSELWLYVLLVVAGILSFLPAFNGGFLSWDDQQYVIENSDIVKINLTKYFTTNYLGNYQPFTLFVYSLIYKVGQLNPFHYHFSNIVLHLLSTLVLFQICKRIFAAPLSAFFLALVFCIHPMQVESVAWIAELKNVLYVLFFFASILFFIKSLEENKRKYLFASLLLFCLSLLAKGQAVALPFTIIALLLVIDRSKLTRSTYIKLIPYFVLALFFGLIAIWSQNDDGYINHRHFYSIPDKIAVASHGYFIYLFKIIAPFQLSAFYPYPETIPLWYFLFLIPILGIAVAFILLMKLKKYILAGCILGFTANIILILQLIPVGEAMLADRYVYLPIIFVFIPLLHYLPPLNLLRRIMYSLLMVMFCSLTYLHAMTFTSTDRLLENVFNHYPENEIVLHSLGVESLKKGNIEKAKDYLLKAVKSDSLFFQAHSNLGTALNMNGEFEVAIPYFKKAVQIEKTYYPAFYGIAVSLNSLQNFDEAILYLDSTIAIQPSYSKAWLLKGICTSKKGREIEALKLYSEAEKRGERSGTLYYNRAISFGNINDFSSAVNELDKAIYYQNNMSQAYYLRGIAKIKTGKKGCDDLIRASQMGYSEAQNALNTFCK